MFNVDAIYDSKKQLWNTTISFDCTPSVVGAGDSELTSANDARERMRAYLMDALEDLEEVHETVREQIVTNAQQVMDQIQRGC